MRALLQVYGQVISWNNLALISLPVHFCILQIRINIKNTMHDITVFITLILSNIHKQRNYYTWTNAQKCIINLLGAKLYDHLKSHYNKENSLTQRFWTTFFIAVVRKLGVRKSMLLRIFWKSSVTYSYCSVEKYFTPSINRACQIETHGCWKWSKS